MKKIGFSFCIFLMGCITFSCSSTSYYDESTKWDPSLPREQGATIFFYRYEPTSYNGINVDKKAFRLVTIPAGIAAFSGDLNWSQQRSLSLNTTGTYYVLTEKDTGFSCTLEGGKEYWIFTGCREMDDQNLVFGVYLAEEEIRAKAGAPDNIIGFFPFDPPIITPPFSQWKMIGIGKYGPK